MQHFWSVVRTESDDWIVFLVISFLFILRQYIGNQFVSLISGVFTAPARGVYYFRFTIWSLSNGYYSGIYLYKNNDVLTFLYGYNYNSYGRFISGGVTVQLDAGDTVRTRIPKNYLIYHTGTNPNIFSGFMLFTIWETSESNATQAFGQNSPINVNALTSQTYHVHRVIQTNKHCFSLTCWIKCVCLRELLILDIPALQGHFLGPRQCAATFWPAGRFFCW